MLAIKIMAHNYKFASHLIIDLPSNPFTSIVRIFVFIPIFLALLSCEKKAFRTSTPAMEGTILQKEGVWLNRKAIPKRNDIIAFTYAGQENGTFLFRMVAEPGDSLRIENGLIYIDGHLQNYPSTLQYSYKIISDFVIPDEKLEAWGLTEMPRRFGDSYLIHTNPQIASKIKNMPGIQSVQRIIHTQEYLEYQIFKDFSGWNKDNLGVFYLPKAGDILPKESFERYAEAILIYENEKLNNQEEYQVKYSYCFVMGDNRDNSLDSRYIGIIPINNVKGTVSKQYK
jgi:signal peptidase I